MACFQGGMRISGKQLKTNPDVGVEGLLVGGHQVSQLVDGSSENLRKWVKIKISLDACDEKILFLAYSHSS